MAVATPPDRSAIGRRSRRKGKAHELVVRDAFMGSALKREYPGLFVRRSSQAERAFEADVIIEGEGLPQWLRDLWLECQHAKDPDPKAKLEQAERDARLALQRTGRDRRPFVVWRKQGARVLWLTCRLHQLVELFGATLPGAAFRAGLTAPAFQLVTIELGAALEALATVTGGRV